MRHLPRIVLLVPALAALALLSSGCQTKAGMKIEETRTLSDLRTQANDAYAAENYALASDIYAEYVSLRPQNVWARRQLGKSLLRDGHPFRAREQLELARDLDPSNLETAEALADAMAEVGQTDQGLALLRDAAAWYATPDAYGVLADYSERSGMLDEALIAHRQAAALEGTATPDAWRSMAAFFARLGDRDREVQALRRVLWFDVRDEAATNRLESFGMIVGPSLAIPPTTPLAPPSPNTDSEP